MRQSDYGLGLYLLEEANEEMLIAGPDRIFFFSSKRPNAGSKPIEYTGELVLEDTVESRE